MQSKTIKIGNKKPEYDYKSVVHVYDHVSIIFNYNIYIISASVNFPLINFTT